MKKILAILCAVLMLASLAAAASAEEAPQTTTITTTVPSTYVLTIPATVEIPYGEKNATIGRLLGQGSQRQRRQLPRRRPHQRLCLGACRCRYLLRHHHLHGLSGNGQRRGLSPR